MGCARLDRPWLDFDLGAEMPVLSWSVNRPGLVRARRILWREVRNRDLPPDLDVADWFAAELAAREAGDAVGFLTSRNVACYTESRASVQGITADVVASTGLSNAERIGRRMDYAARDWGTINIAVRVSAGLTEAARIEALSIAVEARTAAVMEAGFRLPHGIATGTGTDCMAIAAPAGDTAYAGLHTAVGEAIGKAVYNAVRQGATAWMTNR